ncbi:MAG TPA: response regulator [Usitatibacteraceae bacterium]
MPKKTNDDQDPFDLDFTKLFNPATPVKEPQPTAQEEKALTEEAVIGESKLTSNGYFVRINEAAPKRKPHSAPPSVLVVEDDEVTSTLLGRILQANGFRVNYAATRAAIISGLKLFPDIVIMDVMMPDANGFDILNRIRTHATLKDMPVLMLTSLGSLDDILKGLKLGANGYLTKPAKSKALLDAIKQVLS